MSDVPSPPLFPSTRWTLLQRVRHGGAEEVRAALELLCRAYWHPLYCVARQKGLKPHDAQDAVQGFFECLLRRETFTKADETVGKLRHLLLRAFDNYCTQQWARGNRQKRGGGAEHLELTEFLDAGAAEGKFLLSGSENTSMEALYSREWAHAVLERSLQALKEDYRQRGMQARYDLLVGPLIQQEDDSTLEQLAGPAGMTPGALRTALYRMRGHYRDMIKAELAATIDNDDPALIREEMAELFKAFA